MRAVAVTVMAVSRLLLGVSLFPWPSWCYPLARGGGSVALDSGVMSYESVSFESKHMQGRWVVEPCMMGPLHFEEGVATPEGSVVFDDRHHIGGIMELDGRGRRPSGVGWAERHRGVRQSPLRTPTDQWSCPRKSSVVFQPEGHVKYPGGF
ncbi:hypothetical protein DFH29DRAFT_109715 [Suillus ampliporus]|nr:hypothetical protein DFH29DRAFT_109715 [Suillus ampliporus]